MYLLFGEVFGLVLIPVDWIIDILFVFVFVFDDLAWLDSFFLSRYYMNTP